MIQDNILVDKILYKCGRTEKQKPILSPTAEIIFVPFSQQQLKYQQDIISFASIEVFSGISRCNASFPRELIFDRAIADENDRLFILCKTQKYDISAEECTIYTLLDSREGKILSQLKSVYRKQSNSSSVPRLSTHFCTCSAQAVAGLHFFASFPTNPNSGLFIHAALIHANNSGEFQVTL